MLIARWRFSINRHKNAVKPYSKKEEVPMNLQFYSSCQIIFIMYTFKTIWRNRKTFLSLCKIKVDHPGH